MKERAGAPATEDELRELAMAAASGDDQAWQRLWSPLEAKLLAMVSRPRFLGRLSTREDDCRNIVLEVMARLHADGCRRLRMFCESAARDPDLKFIPWISVVAKRVGVDYTRSHEQYIGGRGRPSDSAPAWARPTTLNDGKVGGQRPPVTNSGTAHQLLERAAEVLAPDQKTAVDLWLCGHGHDAIARAMALDDRRDAERLVRAALARIRRAARDGTEDR